MCTGLPSGLATVAVSVPVFAVGNDATSTTRLRAVDAEWRCTTFTTLPFHRTSIAPQVAHVVTTREICRATMPMRYIRAPCAVVTSSNPANAWGDADFDHC